MPSPVQVLPQRSRSLTPKPGSVRSAGGRRPISWDVGEPPFQAEDDLKQQSPSSDISDYHWGVDSEPTSQSLSSLRKIVPKLCAPGQSTGPSSVHPIFNQGKARNNRAGNGGDMVDRLEQLEMRLEWWHQHHEMLLEQLVRSVTARKTHPHKERLKSQRRSCTHHNHILPVPARNSEWPDPTASGRVAAARGSHGEAPKQESADEGGAAAPGVEEAVAAPDGAQEEDNKEFAGSGGDEPTQDDQEEQVEPTVQRKSSGKKWLRTDIDKTRSQTHARLGSKLPERPNYLLRIVKNHHFDHVFAFAIVLNAIFIAVQTEYLVHAASTNDDPVNNVFFAIDKVFAAVFLIELLMRVFGLRRNFFAVENVAWNCFDSFLVAMSMIELILEMKGMDANGEVGNTASGKVMRMFRMARVVRVMRVLRFLDELRTMVLLILHSMRSLFWLMVLLAMILFTFAIFFTQGVADFMLSKSEPTDADRQLRYFYGSLADSSFTLFMSITGGVSWIEAVEPLKTAGWELMGLFIVYVSFCVFSVLNIVTGVFVDGAIQRSAQERDKRLLKEKEQKEVYINMLMDLLHEIDSEGTGVITRGMLEKAFEGERVRYTFSALDIDIHDSNYLFDMLDADDSGEVDMDEFVVGCLRLKGNAKSIDIHTLMFEIRALMRRWDVLFNEDLGT